MKLECVGKEDIAQRKVQPQHIKPTIPNKSASKGCATQGEVSLEIHNHKLQARKKPPRDVQLQGRRAIT